MKTFRALAIGAVVACSGCSSAMQPQDFAAGEPPMLPLKFFAGHTHSWGVLETANGQPEETFQTDATGWIDGTGTLHWPQRLTFQDGTVKERDWIFRRTGEHDYEGTAHDVAGTAHGEAYGNVFHLTFVLERSPGNALKNVDVEEWMYREPDGSVVNRGTVDVVGLTGAMITEYFRSDVDPVALPATPQSR